MHGSCQFLRTKTSFFTLIELLIIISIIAILASLLLPALSLAKERVRQIACANNLKQIGVAMTTYLGDNGNFFPSPLNSAGTAGLDKYWPDLISAYTGAEGKYNSSKKPYYKNTVFDCPSIESVASCPTDYIYCQILWQYWDGGANPWAYYNDSRKVKKPGSVGLVTDGEYYGTFNYANARVGLMGVADSARRIRNVHLKGVNILYCDSHVALESAHVDEDMQDIFDASKHQ